MKVRRYKPEDYPTITRWFEQWGWKQGVPETHLSRCGAIAYDDYGVYACGFLYTSNSALTFLEFVCANKNAKPQQRQEGCRTVIKYLCDVAVELNGPNTVVYTMSINTSYHGLLEQCGFHYGERNITSMFYSPTDLKQYQHLTE